MRNNRKTSSPVRLGAMAPARNRTSDEPTYQQILKKHGLLSRGASIGEAWALWQRVAEDRKVIAAAQEIERPKYGTVASITAGYQHFGKVLSAMSSRQMSALKKRIEEPRR
jgi:hypothetical protein